MKNSWKGKNENKTKILIAIIIAIAVVCVGFLVPKTFKQRDPNETQMMQSYSLNQKDNEKEGTTVETGKVTINYLDEKGNKIIESTVKTGNVGESYDIKRQEISGYTKSGDDPISRAGVFELGNIDVNFIYKTASSEVYKNVTQAGQNEATENQINVMFNNNRTQRDYGLVIITKDENGNSIDGGEFKISKDGKELRRGEVKKGQFFAGKIGVSTEGKIKYEITEEKSTIGYKRVETPINLEIESKWNEEKKKFEISVNDNPQEDITITLNDKDQIVIEIINPKIKDMYEVEIINKAGSDLVTGSKFKVSNEDKIIVDDFVKDGKLYVGGFEIDGEGTDKYVVYETQTAEGYKKVIEEQNPGIVEVTKTFNQDESKYDIDIKYNEIPGFTAEKIGENKVTIYVETEKLEDDKYDLCIKKFVLSIDDEMIQGREPEVTIENGKVKYTQSDEIEKAANEQKVKYTLRTYNESNVKGKGKRIIEYIPDGLVFLPENETNIEYGWKWYKEDEQGDLVQTEKLSEATVVATDYLVDKEIEGFNVEEGEIPNYLDVDVVFQIDESKIKSEDRIIENRVKIEKNENDDNNENDETTEKVYVKYFDLDMEKYTKRVIVKNSLKETTKEIGKIKRGQLVKVDIPKNEVENTTLTVTYVLKVTNIGEIAGYATELVDYIPKDFKLVEDGMWKVKGNEAVTTKLENKLIEPGESEEIEITFDWKLTSNNIGSRINEGKIREYENEYNAKDPTEDNNDTEEMLVAVRTGSIWAFIVIAVLAVLWIALGIVYLLKKRNSEE